MTKKTFEGKSDTGNFQEALAEAIENAKQSLLTDFVEWEIDKVYGEDGGIVTVQILKVIIIAKPYSN